MEPRVAPAYLFLGAEIVELEPRKFGWRAVLEQPEPNGLSFVVCEIFAVHDCDCACAGRRVRACDCGADEMLKRVQERVGEHCGACGSHLAAGAPHDGDCPYVTVHRT